MAAITDPEAIRFVNEVVRPLCQESRALANKLKSLRTVWYGGLDAKFSKGDDAVDDGREAEGVSRLLAADVTNAVAQLLKTAEGEAAAWNGEVIQKPCVHFLP